MLKSYVLKPTWLFNKATWEKEANTQSTTIFVTTEIHENKMVIHEIGMGFLISWRLLRCHRVISCFGIHPAFLKTSVSKDLFLISSTSSLRITSRCWKLGQATLQPILVPAMQWYSACSTAFCCHEGVSIPFFHSAIFVVAVLKASWSLFVVCWRNALHSFLVCAFYMLVWLTRSRFFWDQIGFP